jgi:hypothetical protein
LAAIAFAVGLLGLTLGLGWALVAAMTGAALAASPGASAGAAGDPRSSGQGPGLVGDPILAVGLVLAIGLAAVVATLAYVRWTSRSAD